MDGVCSGYVYAQDRYSELKKAPNLKVGRGGKGFFPQQSLVGVRDEEVVSPSINYPQNNLTNC